VNWLCRLFGHRVRRVSTPSGAEADFCLRCGQILRLHLSDVEPVQRIPVSIELVRAVAKDLRRQLWRKLYGRDPLEPPEGQSR
jgi:hypothetical protein